MEGVKPGQIKRLLILESLPKQVNFSGGQDLLSWLGTFTLERGWGRCRSRPMVPRLLKYRPIASSFSWHSTKTICR